jgi:RNA polymerase sigma-70 factor (ECF subfamily)
MEPNNKGEKPTLSDLETSITRGEPMDIQADFEYLRSMADSTDKKEIVVDLMTAYGNYVWNYAFSITKKHELADDITQEVFLKVFRSLFTFRSESSIKTWLFAITRNTIYDYRRSAFFRKVTLVQYVDYTSSHMSAESEVMEQLEINDIWQKVLELPLKYREVIILYGHEQLSMREIAQILSISEGKVKSRLYRARIKLQKMTEDEHHGS